MSETLSLRPPRQKVIRLCSKHKCSYGDKACPFIEVIFASDKRIESADCGRYGGKLELRGYFLRNSACKEANPRGIFSVQREE